MRQLFNLRTLVKAGTKGPQIAPNGDADYAFSISRKLHRLTRITLGTMPEISAISVICGHLKRSADYADYADYGCA
jgi:hypothetical protein